MRSFALVGLLALSACGYQPLYATNDDGSSVSQKLAEVSVAQQSDRVSQLVRNEIVSSTRPVGTEAQNRYHLKLQAKGDAQTLIDTQDTVHRRLAYNLTTKFQLVDAATSNVVFSGQAFSRVPYDRLDASFANVQARVNAEEQAAKQVGQEVRTRLAAFLATN
ncbi:MAG: hypothetical protein ABJM26_11060 [Anderseniella sp.]